MTGLVHLWLLIRRRIFRRCGVYVLSYHHVVAGEAASRHEVTTSQLARHLRFVARWFQVIRFEDIPVVLERPRLDQDYVALTFDDGYEDNYKHAFPLLRQRGTPATIFLIAGLAGTSAIPWYDECRLYLSSLSEADVSGVEGRAGGVLAELVSITGGRTTSEDRIERALDVLKAATPEDRSAVLEWLRRRCGDAIDQHGSQRMRIISWEQAREMARHGMSFGSHTLTHPILTTLSLPQIDAELRTSRAVIERQLGVTCTTFAFPNGDFDDRSVDALKAQGFSAACTQIFGANRPGDSVLRLKRIGLGYTPVSVLAAKVSGLFSPAYAIRQLWRTRHDKRAFG